MPEPSPPAEIEDRYSRGRMALAQALDSAIRRNLAPPPKLTVSQWAERYAMLSPETSAQTGRFRAFGYQPGIMDAFSDPTVEEVVVKKSARVGYTKILDNVTGYFIHQDPSPILAVQPRVEDAEDYSATEIAPMLRDTPVLAEIAGDLKAKDGSQKLLKRVFRNGASWSGVGANSPGGFRRITARVILLDEVDGYPVNGAGNEGDQIRLARKRGETFWNRKVGLGSTPTVKGTSRIEKAWEDSDQRFFYVACPHCGERQVLEWGGIDVPHGIKWDKAEDGTHLPETAYYVCRASGCIIEELHKPDMVAAGEWRPTKPFNGRAGFHIWAGYSLHVNAGWGKLAKEWLEVKGDPLARQTFVNLVLGEVYEDRGDKALNERSLAQRAEVWPDGQVPLRAALLTAGIDMQDDRAEAEIVAWGANEERWSIAHEVIDGDPDEPGFWVRVDELLKRTWYRADGHPFSVSATCIDSGGHHTQKVYEFSKARIGQKVWAIKGEAARGGARSPVWPTKRPSARNKSSFRPVMIGVNAAKDVIRARLHLDPPKGDEPVPGYMHYPTTRDLGFFAQLVAERSVVKQQNGQRFRIWELRSGRRNEALDLAVYSYAALCGLQHLGTKLNQKAEQAMRTITAPVPPVQPRLPVPTMPEPLSPTPVAPAPPAARPAPRKSRWVR